MNWNKISIKSIMDVFRVMEKDSMTLCCNPSIIYSDGKEELKISYRRLD